MLPTLQSDPRHPPAPLADCRPQRPRKIFARRYRRGSLEPDRQEELAAAHGVQTESGLIVFGETVGIEDPAAARGREPFEGAAAEARAHAVRGQKSAEPLPDRNILRLIFGELVAVEAVREFTGWSRQGQD